MAYTAEQLAEVRQAIVDLAAGKRVVTITRDGRTVQYAQTDINKLRSLAAEIADDLAAQAGNKRTRIRYAVTSKGL